MGCCEVVPWMRYDLDADDASVEHPATRWLVYGISPFAAKLSGDPPPVRHVAAEEGGWALALQKAAQYKSGQGEVRSKTIGLSDLSIRICRQNSARFRNISGRLFRLL